MLRLALTVWAIRIVLAGSFFLLAEAFLSSSSFTLSSIALHSRSALKMSSVTIVKHRSPLLLRDSSSTEDWATAMVILNAPIIAQPLSPLFARLWKSTNFHVCADGGANRLRHAITESGDVDHYIPNVITGDLDSLTDETRKYYEEKGVQIVQIIDQDRNDLDKALSSVLEHYKDSRSIRCVVYGAFGGRFDQEMASFQALYKWHGKVEMYLYDDSTMAFLLPGGCENHIQLALLPTKNESADTTSEEDVAVSEGPICGLIPLGCAVDSVTTTGLQWNLNHETTQFGGLVSTSNRIVVPELPAAAKTLAVVTVKCSQPLVFTAEVHSRSASAWSR